MEHGQHFTFYCLGHSDLHSHFENLNISNTSLTLCEPHKPKHTLFTLSSKHDSMCHGKICIGQRNITNQKPEFTWQGIPSFLESFKLSPWPVWNCFTYTNEKSGYLEYSPLRQTMNNGKLI